MVNSRTQQLSAILQEMLSQQLETVRQLSHDNGDGSYFVPQGVVDVEIVPGSELIQYYVRMIAALWTPDPVADSLVVLKKALEKLPQTIPFEEIVSTTAWDEYSQSSTADERRVTARMFKALKRSRYQTVAILKREASVAKLEKVRNINTRLALRLQYLFDLPDF